MYRFAHSQPIDLTIYEPPPMEDRSGTPLSQGVILILIGTVVAEYCSPELLDAVEVIEPNTWYHGQLLESVLNEFEDTDPTLPLEVGKNVYYALRSQFIELGIHSPQDVIQTLPMVWRLVTRGDSGEWRSWFFGPGKARMEAEQPYNCQFEQGALQGALEAFDATNVHIAHTTCIRQGHPFCTFEITWDDGA